MFWPHLRFVFFGCSLLLTIFSELFTGVGQGHYSLVLSVDPEFLIGLDPAVAEVSTPFPMDLSPQRFVGK